MDKRRGEVSHIILSTGSSGKVLLQSGNFIDAVYVCCDDYMSMRLHRDRTVINITVWIFPKCDC